MAAKQNCSLFDESVWNRSCKKEIIKPIDGKVIGTIPKWLNGVLIRNGPGLFQFGDTSVKHLFDGMALLHRFEMKDGVVTYQCRFLQTDIYKKNKAANRVTVTDFGTKSVPDPCRTIFYRILSEFNLNSDISDNASISLYPFGDEIYTFAETGVMYRVDNDNLTTKNKMDLTKKFGIVTHTSHPHVISDGTVYNLALSCSNKDPLYHIVCFPSKPKGSAGDYSMFDKAHVIANIPARWKMNPSYMHTFGITKNYFVIVEQPFSIGILKVFIHMVLNRPAHQLTNWNKNETTKISIVSRRSGDVVNTFYAKGFFYFHIINQYEYKKHCILDICTYQDSSVIDSMYIEAMKNGHNDQNIEMLKSVPRRFVLPLSEKSNCGVDENLVNLPNTSAKAFMQRDGCMFVEPETISEIYCDMPTIYYEKFSGRKYQYFYATSTKSSKSTEIIKVDLNDKSSKTWWEDDSFPSEPIFVPTPNTQSEDDGVILTCLIHKKRENFVSLLVLDAKTFKEIGRVQFHTLSTVPNTFHGWYFPQK